MVESNWTPPTEFPNIRDAGLISLDCETKDPNLQTLGPGGVRRDGHVIGVSIATDTGYRGYYPIRHEGGGNLEVNNVLRWLRDSLSGNQPKIGANIIYDLEWLRSEGVTVNGPKWDVQIAEPLLDENRTTYRLEALAQSYLGRGKDERLLTDAAASLGIKEKDVKANLWQLHSKYVGPYGETDADLPLKIFEKQKAQLEMHQLWQVFELETKLVDVLLAMRFKGIPVDIGKAERIRNELLGQQRTLQENINKTAGFEVDIWSADSIERYCQSAGLQYSLTGKGNASFEGDWLSGHEDPTLQAIAKCRKLDRLGGVFIESKILQVAHNGRIYPTFRQVRSDDGGTRSGRFASASPNMQQIPSRDGTLAPLLRSIFVPEHGCQWGVLDYSQQEPRVTVHYAFISELRGAAEARARYIEHPDTDYHSWVAEVAQIERRVAKDMNLGLAYGMGKSKMAAKLGKTMAETDAIYNTYHSAVPFIKLLGQKCTAVAKARGFIKTILGRHRHYNLYGPPKWSKGVKVFPKLEALREYGPPVIQYFTHNALNGLIQGSSADMMKKAMVDAYEAGYVIPLTIHDELDPTDITDIKQMRELRDIMCNAVKLEVPLKVDCKLGPSWGEATKVEL